MSIINFPIGRCEAVREMVLLDATQHECACEHGCPPGFDCPLAGYFAEVSGLSDETAAALKLSGKCLKRARPAAPA